MFRAFPISEIKTVLKNRVTTILKDMRERQTISKVISGDVNKRHSENGGLGMNMYNTSFPRDQT